MKLLLMTTYLLELVQNAGTLELTHSHVMHQEMTTILNTMVVINQASALSSTR